MFHANADRLPVARCTGRFDLSDLVETRLEKSADHPITAGIADFDVREELYYRLKFAKPAGSIEPIVTICCDAGIFACAVVRNCIGIDANWYC